VILLSTFLTILNYLCPNGIAGEMAIFVAFFHLNEMSSSKRSYNILRNEGLARQIIYCWAAQKLCGTDRMPGRKLYAILTLRGLVLRGLH